MDKARIEFLTKDFIRGFPAFCNLEVLSVGRGRFESQLRPNTQHAQRDGYVHAGMLATMADHTAGYAAYTLVEKHISILTIELKINYFKPAVGERIVCRSKVIHQGRTILVAESELFAITAESEKLVAKATVTLMAIANRAAVV
ncbi:MAG: PaaI family thioesterase [Desulfobacteraceae bacterium]|nr:PaaI family thioesterase [Desulfobacteraceae bacterium]